MPGPDGPESPKMEFSGTLLFGTRWIGHLRPTVSHREEPFFGVLQMPVSTVIRGGVCFAKSDKSRSVYVRKKKRRMRRSAPFFLELSKSELLRKKVLTSAFVNFFGDQIPMVICSFFAKVPRPGQDKYDDLKHRQKNVFRTENSSLRADQIWTFQRRRLSNGPHPSSENPGFPIRFRVRAIVQRPTFELRKSRIPHQILRPRLSNFLRDDIF